MIHAWLRRTSFTHPAVWTFAACWIAAAGWLLFEGRGVRVAEGTGLAVAVLLLCRLTVRLTDQPPQPIPPEGRERVYLGIQLLLLAGVVVITGWAGMHFHRVSAAPPHIPFWTTVEHWSGRLGERYLDPALVGGPYYALANPVRYCLLPLLFLAPLTGFRYLGLDPGHRVSRVATLWCAIPLAIAAHFIVTGGLTLAGFARRLLSNTLQNGPFEEFLFRGAIQTRLAVLLGPAWGIVLSSLAFGLWHLGAEWGYAQTAEHPFADGLAGTMLSQAVLGLGLGSIYHRTRNLVASSVCHVVMNSAA